MENCWLYATAKPLPLLLLHRHHTKWAAAFCFCTHWCGLVPGVCCVCACVFPYVWSVHRFSSILDCILPLYFFFTFHLPWTFSDAVIARRKSNKATAQGDSRRWTWLTFHFHFISNYALILNWIELMANSLFLIKLMLEPCIRLIASKCTKSYDGHWLMKMTWNRFGDAVQNTHNIYAIYYYVNENIIK